MATTTRYVTDEELLQVPRDGQKYERVDGELRVNPAGFRHGAVILRLAIRLGAFVAERKLGPRHVAADIGCHSFAMFEPFMVGNSITGYGMGHVADRLSDPARRRADG